MRLREKLLHSALVVLVLSLLLVPGGRRVSAAETQIQWVKHSGALSLSGERFVGDVSVINDAGTYKMWYSHGKTNQTALNIANTLTQAIPGGMITSISGLALVLFLSYLNSSAAQHVDIGLVKSLLDNSSMVIGYATSTDGVNWTVGTNSQVLAGADGGAWSSVGAPAVIKDGSTYKMWYTRLKTNLTQASLQTILNKLSTAGQRKAGYLDLLNSTTTVIGYATSPDGIVWTPVDPPVLEGSGGAWNSVGAPSVIKDGAGLTAYKMWYTRAKTDITQATLDAMDPATFGIDQLADILDDTSTVIGYATSADGIVWNKGNNQVLAGSTGGAWNSTADPSVVNDGGTYRAWYAQGRTDLTKPTLKILLTEMAGKTQQLWDILKAFNAGDLTTLLNNLNTLEIGTIRGHLANTNTAIAYATSPNGEVWTLQDTQQLQGSTSSAWSSVGAPSVIGGGAVFKAWFTQGIGDLSVANLISLALGTTLPIGLAVSDTTPTTPPVETPPVVEAPPVAAPPPVSGGGGTAPPGSPPPVSAPPVETPPVSAPPVSAPPVSAPPPSAELVQAVQTAPPSQAAAQLATVAPGTAAAALQQSLGTAGQVIAQMAPATAAGIMAAAVQANAQTAGQLMTATAQNSVPVAAQVVTAMSQANVQTAALTVNAMSQANVQTAALTVNAMSQANVQTAALTVNAMSQANVQTAALTVNAMSQANVQTAALSVNAMSQANVQTAALTVNAMSQANVQTAALTVNAMSQANVQTAAQTVNAMSVANVQTAAQTVNAMSVANVQTAGLTVAAMSQANDQVAGVTLAAMSQANPGVAGGTIGTALVTNSAATGRAVGVSGANNPGATVAALRQGTVTVPGALTALASTLRIEAVSPRVAPALGASVTGRGTWRSVGSPVPVSAVLARLDSDIQGAHVKVEDVAALPPGASALPARQIVSAYVRLTPENFGAQNLLASDVTFSVEKGWLKANGIHPFSVSFARYDESRKAWVEFTGKWLNEDDQRYYYTANPPGFSLWAIAGSKQLPPVQFNVDGLKIDSASVQEGKSVTIQVQVTNLTDQPGDYNVALWLNDVVETSKTVALPAKGVVPVSFSVQAKTGSYKVRVDSLQGSFAVTPATVVTPAPPTPPAPRPTPVVTPAPVTPPAPVPTQVVTPAPPAPQPQPSRTPVVLLIAIIAVLAVIVGVVFYLRRRRTA